MLALIQDRPLSEFPVAGEFQGFLKRFIQLLRVYFKARGHSLLTSLLKSQTISTPDLDFYQEEMRKIISFSLAFNRNSKLRKGFRVNCAIL